MSILSKSYVYSSVVVGLLATSCGKDKKEETVYVTQPQTANPQQQPQQAPVQPQTPAAPVAQNQKPQGPQPQTLVEQVGDLFKVAVLPGQHVVFSSSTYEQPGFLKFKMIDGSMKDSAAPYPLYCTPNANFQEQVSELSPAGQMLNYCKLTPSIAFNAPNDPIFNSFRWTNMNTMTYNSLAISSDTTLGAGSQGIGNNSGSMKMYINLFTDIAAVGRTSPYYGKFATEFSQTASRLYNNCGGQVPQYLGTTSIFQGYFNGSVAISPIFGCSTPRNGKWYVSVGAFPMDRATQVNPSVGWNGWVSQRFVSARAAEIVVEMGPFDYAPVASQVAAEAQNMMVTQIKKFMN